MIFKRIPVIPITHNYHCGWNKYKSYKSSFNKNSYKKSKDFDYEKQLKEGKKKLQKEQRKAISSDGDTSKFIKPKKSHITPLKEISFEELSNEKDD